MKQIEISVGKSQERKKEGRKKRKNKEEMRKRDGSRVKDVIHEGRRYK